MFAFLSSPTARPILTSEDHALLALIVEERFTLTHVVANYEAAHPARQSLLTLTRWLKLPHIDTALKTLIADLREYESIRHEFLQRHSIDGLVDAMHSASRNLKLLEEARTHNIQHTRAVEELRLAAQALNRATKPGGTASRGTVPAPRGRAASESHSTEPISDQLDSASPSALSTQHSELSSAPRSPDALTSDNNSLSTDPDSDPCVSASPSPRSGAHDEPGVATPGKESTPITLPSSFLSTEGAALSASPAPLRGAKPTQTTNGGTATRLPPPIHPQPDGLKIPRTRHPRAPPDTLSIASRRQLNHHQHASRARDYSHTPFPHLAIQPFHLPSTPHDTHRQTPHPHRRHPHRTPAPGPLGRQRRTPRRPAR